MDGQLRQPEATFGLQKPQSFLTGLTRVLKSLQAAEAAPMSTESARPAETEGGSCAILDAIADKLKDPRIKALLSGLVAGACVMYVMSLSGVPNIPKWRKADKIRAVGGKGYPQGMVCISVEDVEKYGGEGTLEEKLKRLVNMGNFEVRIVMDENGKVQAP